MSEYPLNAIVHVLLTFPAVQKIYTFPDERGGEIFECLV